MMARTAEVLLCLLVLGLPFEFYFGDRANTLATSLKATLALFLAAWLALGVSRRFRGLTTLVPRRLAAALAVFAGVEALAAALAPEFRGNAARAAAKWLVGPLIFVAAGDLGRGGVVRGPRLLGALSLGGSLAALVGLGDWIGSEPCSGIIALFQPRSYSAGALPRLSSTMEYPNTAASLLSAGLFAGLALVRHPVGTGAKQGIWRAVAAASAGLQAAALVLTLSRGALMAAAVSLGTLAWLTEDSVRGRRRLVAGGLALALLVGVQYLAVALSSADGAPGPRRIARFGLAAASETRHLAPLAEYRETILVRNDSSRTWRRDGFGVAYRWHHLASRSSTRLAEGATFREEIGIGQERRVQVRLATPAEEGEYLLIWFVVRWDPGLQELDHSYSPAILCSVRSSPAPHAWSPAALEYLPRIRGERARLPLELVPSRWDLWGAALRMFVARPVLGWGSDSYRLLKGRFMEIPKGDDTILANSLYLEFLACSGVLGFSAFLWLVWELGRGLLRRSRAAGSPEERSASWFGVAYFVAFLVHGLVDYFLKFTPTFVLFWVVTGSLAGRASAEGSDAPRL
jgi:hypothetical protein